LLEGKLVNLIVQEKEDISLVAEWMNNPSFGGEYENLHVMSRTELEKRDENPYPDEKWFMIEKKDGTKIGNIGHFTPGRLWEIGYSLIPTERNKGYCTEAAKIMVDYLFLSQNIVRIQARTIIGNKASQRVLEKVGFKKEGTMRKSYFARGEWKDTFLYSILREEWKEPIILTKTVPQK
jgi:RimJ/RimL family protein N-acetyltransferase